jgi:tetratricopeptide (TPR) repeat protein
VKSLLTIFILIAGFSAEACYFIIGRKQGRVMVGYNEDWYRSNSKYWFEHPSKKEKYGAVFFGFGGEFKIAQGGINEKGLFFDGNAIPKQVLKDSTKQGKKAAPVPIFKNMLKHCANVDEAIRYLQHFYIPFIKSVQIILADAQGNYAVIDLNGIVEKGTITDGYKIITNFRPTDNAHFCYRYDLTAALLEKGFSNQVATFEKVLFTARQTFPGATVYSTISDLGSQQINLYYNHKIVNKVEIDLKKSLKEGKTNEVALEDLFPKRMIHDLIKVWDKKGVAAAISFFDQEKNNPNTKFQVDAEQLYDLTNVLLNRQHVDESLIVARKNAEYFPDSDLGFEALGKSLFWNGYQNESRLAYDKAKSINPENRWARLVLPQLSTGGLHNEGNMKLILRGFQNAKAVAVAGVFNEWQSLQNICSKNDEGAWHCYVTLLPGTYYYRFVVDGHWVDDPGNPPKHELEKGFFVSVLEVK